MTTPQSRLLKLADEAVADYNATHAAGGEAVYPSWVEDVRLLCNAAPGVATAGNPQPARDWELTCHECDGSGHVYVKHQVAERQSDVQEFKEECECCEGRGFVFAFQDIPGIEQYVKSCRPASVAPGDAQDEDDSIALDKLADYIADTWPDKKYGLEEICQRLHAMWPGEFIPLEDLSKNLPNVREALRALLTHWKRFQASDGNQQDAYNLMVKGARHAWQFAEAEIKRVPATAPAAGDAPAIVLPAKMPKHESDGGEYPSSESYKEGYAEGWNDAIDAAIAAQRKGDA